MKFIFFEKALFRLACILWVCLAVGCGSVQDRVRLADELAVRQDFVSELVRTERFQLKTYHRLRKEAENLVVYIEGDGYAFIDRSTPSPDPTPRNPMALKLASLDQSGNVIYIARPCQYTLLADEKSCSLAYWTDRRYAPEIIEAVNQVIDYYKEMNPGKGIRLVGFSGGGTIAALLAGKRQDVIDLRTIAGNLDIVGFSQIHGLSPLRGSLNPVDYATSLYSVPQLHYLGSKDKTITTKTTMGYAQAIKRYDPLTSCVRFTMIDNMTHSSGWEEFWATLKHGEIQSCNSKSDY